jgi:immunity protein 30 of polymorphic toxin system
LDIHKLTQQLFDNRLMRDPSEVKRFEHARLALLGQEDSSLLHVLFGSLDDSTEQHDVMWGLIHDAESFEQATYLRELAIALPAMTQRAPEWRSILLQRVLNSPAAAALFKKTLQMLPAGTKSKDKKILSEMAKSSPRFAARIKKVISA